MNVTCQRVVPPKGDRQMPSPCVVANGFSECLTSFRHQLRVFQNSNRRVAFDRYAVEFMVPLEQHIPAKVLYLVNEAGFDELNGPLVDTWFWLCTI